VCADGGAIRNRFLMQFIADMTRLEIIAAPVAECSPLGAAFLGGLGVGLYSSLDEISRLPNNGEKFSSTMPTERAARFQSGWQRAIKQVLAGIE
jgi:glycerol kinase